jgi:hypothetical protein
MRIWRFQRHQFLAEKQDSPTSRTRRIGCQGEDPDLPISVEPNWIGAYHRYRRSEPVPWSVIFSKPTRAWLIDNGVKAGSAASLTDETICTLASRADLPSVTRLNWASAPVCRQGTARNPYGD